MKHPVPIKSCGKPAKVLTFYPAEGYENSKNCSIQLNGECVFEQSDEYENLKKIKKGWLYENTGLW